MKRLDAKEAILREWMALKPEDRATDTHARLFAISKAGEYRYRSAGDRADVIEGWLRQHVDNRGRGRDGRAPAFCRRFADRGGRLPHFRMR
jgi:hypothetical protein